MQVLREANAAAVADDEASMMALVRSMGPPGRVVHRASCVTKLPAAHVRLCVCLELLSQRGGRFHVLNPHSQPKAHNDGTEWRLRVGGPRDAK